MKVIIIPRTWLGFGRGWGVGRVSAMAWLAGCYMGSLEYLCPLQNSYVETQPQGDATRSVGGPLGGKLGHGAEPSARD